MAKIYVFFQKCEKNLNFPERLWDWQSAATTPLKITYNCVKTHRAVFVDPAISKLLLLQGAGTALLFLYLSSSHPFKVKSAQWEFGNKAGGKSGQGGEGFFSSIEEQSVRHFSLSLTLLRALKSFLALEVWGRSAAFSTWPKIRSPHSRAKKFAAGPSTWAPGLPEEREKPGPLHR